MKLLFYLHLVMACPVMAQTAMYAVGNGNGDLSSSIYRIENWDTNPTAVEIGESGQQLFDLAIDPKWGEAYGVRGGSLYDVDLVTGIASNFKNTTRTNLNALEITGDGRLLAWGNGPDGDLYELNRQTGAATKIVDIGMASGGDIAYDPVTGFVYGSTGDQLIRIDIVAQNFLVIGAFGVDRVYGLDIDLAGNLWALREGLNGADAEFHLIDKVSGASLLSFAVASSGPFGASGLSFGVEDLLLTGPFDGAAGVVNRLEVHGGIPGEKIFFAWGKNPGFTATNICNLTIDIDSARRLAIVPNDGGGVAVLDILVPLRLKHQTRFAQALEPASCRISNLIGWTFF